MIKITWLKKTFLIGMSVLNLVSMSSCSSPADVLYGVVAVPVCAVAMVVVTPICIVSIFRDGDWNVTNDKKFHYLKDKSFVLKEDLIYLQKGCMTNLNMDNTGNFALDEGYDYENGNYKWINVETDTNEIEKIKDSNGEYTVFCRVKPGTIISIYRIDHRKSTFGVTRYVIYAKIESGPFKGYKADICNLIQGLSAYGNSLPIMDEEKIELIESQ